MKMVILAAGVLKSCLYYLYLSRQMGWQQNTTIITPGEVLFKNRQARNFSSFF
jgi:hypothetical protein